MSEHVHEWADEYDGYVGWFACEICKEQMSVGAAVPHLNAAERLSAEAALRLADAIDSIAIVWDGRDGGKGTKRLRAYAKARDE